MISLTGQFKERAQLDVAKGKRQVEDQKLAKEREESIQKNELKEEKQEAWNPQRGKKQANCTGRHTVIPYKSEILNEVHLPTKQYQPRFHDEREDFRNEINIAPASVKFNC